MSESCTAPLNDAPTGPILIFATAAKDVSLVFSSDWQPGMHALSTAASFSIAHTFVRSAGKVTSPVMVIAIDVSPFLFDVRGHHRVRHRHLIKSSTSATSKFLARPAVKLCTAPHFSG